MTDTEDILDIPDFLIRPITEEDKRLAKLEDEQRKLHPGALLKMPTSHRWNAKVEGAKIRKEAYDARLERKEVKGEKVQHPTTVAIKKWLGSLKGPERRSACYELAKENGINPARRDDLNNGQVAMNLTNTIRGKFYKGDKVYIGGELVDNDYLDKLLTPT